MGCRVNNLLSCIRVRNAKVYIKKDCSNLNFFGRQFFVISGVGLNHWQHLLANLMHCHQLVYKHKWSSCSETWLPFPRQKVIIPNPN